MKSYVIFLVTILVSVPTIKHASAWTFCANENGRCNFSGIKQVRYGIEGRYEYKTFNNGAPCSSGIFGDPAPGRSKSCYFDSAELNLSFSGDWKFCANDGFQCKFHGIKAIQYGAEGHYISGYFINGVQCSTQSFGDPVPGVTKHCDVADLNVDLSKIRKWNLCANENDTCNINGLVAVKFGAGNQYVYDLLSASVRCSIDIFGDPAPGIVKQCYTGDLRDLPPDLNGEQSKTINERREREHREHEHRK